MHDFLSTRAADLSRLTMTIQTNLDSAEDTIQNINRTLAELASLGVQDFQITGPVVYVRPARASSDEDDTFTLFQAVLLMPGGIGGAVWDSVEYTEYLRRPHGEPTDRSGFSRRTTTNFVLTFGSRCENSKRNLLMLKKRSPRLVRGYQIALVEPIPKPRSKTHSP